MFPYPAAPTNDQVLTYDSLFQEWQPKNASGGENNTASNVGAGDGIFKQKTGVDLEFKSITAGQNINLTSNVDDVEVALDREIDGGGFNPSFSNLVNLGAVTVGRVWYTRIGNAVTCSFRCLPSPTSTGTCSFRMNLPIARTGGNFSTTFQAGGSCTFRNANLAQSKEGIITPVTGTQQLLVEWETIGSTVTQVMGGSFGYQLNN